MAGGLRPRPAGLLASERSAARGGRRYYDHLSTPRLVTDAAGAIRAKHNLLPFGQELTPMDQEQYAWGWDTPLLFTGHERDLLGGTGHHLAYLDYMHARHYSPFAGRFLSVDPGRDWDPSQPQRWNLYAYARNNPANVTDPDGRVADVIFDVGSAIWGIYDLWDTALSGRQITATQNLAVLADIGAAFAPGVSGAGGFVRVSGKLDKVADTSKKADRAGMDFTRAGKRQIDEANAAKHGGKNVCDSCGTDVIPAKRHQAGVTPPKNERHRDHIVPKTKGGSGTPGNGRVACRECNLRDGNKPKVSAPCTPGKADCK